MTRIELDQKAIEYLAKAFHGGNDLPVAIVQAALAIVLHTPAPTSQSISA